MLGGNLITEPNMMLVVDLDGTLLKSDMLHETFWNAFAANWYTPFIVIRNLLFEKAVLKSFKATLKSYLVEHSDVDITHLPYDEKVISHIIAHRNNGGRVALVTATHQTLAIRIAEHLELFVEVHGSDASRNLKGNAKAQFLLERYGQGNFIYMGDAAADLPVWQVANKIVTVNAAPSVRQQAERLGKPFEHLVTTAKSFRPYMKALRPHQWMKNLLLFVPMLAGHQLDSATLFTSTIAFIAFSLVASSVYALNDLLDLNADRAHPRKRLRPFASGAVPIGHGSILALVLLTAGTALAALMGWTFLLTLAGYYILTTAYSLSLKRKIIIDICVLAGLYSIRILAGGVATGIELSVWLLAFSTFVFFSLAAVKRQAELVDMAKRGALTAKGRCYHVEDLPIITIIGLAAGYISVLVMALYINSPAVQKLYALPDALWGICCLLLYWLTRVVLLTHRGLMDDDPVVFAIKDRVSQICFVAMLVFAIGGTLL